MHCLSAAHQGREQDCDCVDASCPEFHERLLIRQAIWRPDAGSMGITGRWAEDYKTRNFTQGRDGVPIT